MKVMVVVTHLLGTGHLARALILGRAFAGAGHDVQVLSGGMPAPLLDTAGIRFTALPPLRSDGTDFTRLLTDAGCDADPAYLARRQGVLVGAITRFRPDILITELFPFGRRILRNEFLALLEAAADLPRRPVILSSIRDILAPPGTPQKVARTEEIIARYYDGVLVHSDPQSTPLSLSWPVSPALSPSLRYTGYVTQALPPPHPHQAGRGEIIVSAGGGAVGDPLFAAARDAASLSPHWRWRLLVAGAGADRRIAELRARPVPDNIVIEPARSDFRAMLRQAAASLSLCGYNTAMDLLQAGTPSVLVPFDAGNEVEQGLRARGLGRLPGFRIVTASALSPQALVTALRAAMDDAPRIIPDQVFRGAARSVTIATRLAEQAHDA